MLSNPFGETIYSSVKTHCAFNNIFYNTGNDTTIVTDIT